MVKTDNMTEQLRPMDELLKETIVNVWREAIQAKIENNLVKCFELLQIMFKSISPYDFPLKEELGTMDTGLQNLCYEVSTRPSNQEEKLRQQEAYIMLDKHIDDYQEAIINALASINLWFKSVKISDDILRRFSDQTFNSDVETVIEKRKVLLKKNLTVRGIIEKCGKGFVHHLYNIYVLQAGMKGYLEEANPGRKYQKYSSRSHKVYNSK